MSAKHAIAAAVGVAALAIPVGAGAAKVKPHGSYKGTTSQVDGKGNHAAIDFTVAKGARKLSKLSVQARADCKNGPAQYFTLPGRNEKIDGKGRFSDAGTVNVTVDNARSGKLTAVIHGRFKSASRASGTFTASMDISDATGAVVDHCESGTVTWSAKRTRR